MINIQYAIWHGLSDKDQKNYEWWYQDAYTKQVIIFTDINEAYRRAARQQSAYPTLEYIVKEYIKD